MLFLILGIILGIIVVLFVLQNTAIVMVGFAGWQLEGSLALILILTLIAGIVITLLVLLPSFIGDAFSLSAARRKIIALETELTNTKAELAEKTLLASRPDTIVVETKDAHIHS